MKRMAVSGVLAVLAAVLTARYALGAATCQDNLSCNDPNMGLGIVNNTNNSSSAHGISAFAVYSTAVSCSSVSNDAVRSVGFTLGASAIYGESNACHGFGVAGRSTAYGGLCQPSAVTGVATDATSVYAGQFSWDVFIAGDLNVSGSKSFRIDHPMFPSTKFLVHSAIESDQPKNVYRGSVILDASGRARVELPDYFETLNREFRYQLSSVGAFAAPFVLEEVADNAFWIGGHPNSKVSWQVTGVRNDKRMRENPFLVVRPRVRA